MFYGVALTAVFLISLSISLLICQRGHSRLLDLPVARSAHLVPTPRGGGLAIVIAVLLFAGYLTWSGSVGARQFAVLLCALPVAITGFIDDLRGLPVRIRLPIHLLSAFVALTLLGPVPEPFFSGWLLIPGFFQSLLLMLALVWLLNLYNFMDGIDSLASAQTLFVSGAAGIMLFYQQTELAWVCAGLFAACLGFLALNLPPARLFMGDVGSTFIGFFIGLIALISHYQGTLSVWVWVLLMGGFIADTTYTLIRRIASGQRVTEAHNLHAYQHLSRRTGSHASVVMIYSAVNLTWLLPMAWFAVIYPQNGVYLTMVGVVPLMAVAALLGAGKTHVSTET
jgi:Fuc2NAc and GlcNAc transferase